MSNIQMMLSVETSRFQVLNGKKEIEEEKYRKEICKGQTQYRKILVQKNIFRSIDSFFSFLGCALGHVDLSSMPPA